MKDFVRTDGRWYLVLEFIDGDNLLNRVIADGCFSEKRARAYSRQIASALDYCHKNHIVHRDIKLENILLTRSGDIKLMDFVLSNSFSPKSNLDTFCGSLYFSAPELLQRQPYIGPEIDVYSFGVVIYTMVVGEVPFDDENMAKLQGKIKTAAVKYPTFLSQCQSIRFPIFQEVAEAICTDCCQLISRMLEKRPAQRASLAEIIIHPWMVKGFPGPPENYLPRRVPLTLPLDMNVIGRMGGFGFGSSTEIHDTIKNALLSNNGSVTPIVPKRIPSLYKRRNSSHTSLHKVTQEEDAATPNLSPKKDIPEAMISIYHLVREKMQREWLDLQEPTNSNEERVVKPALNLTSTGAFEYATRGSIQAQSFRMEPSEQKEDAEPELSANSIGNRVPRSTAVPLGSGSTKTSTAALLLRRFSTRRRPSPSAQSSTASG
jgi:serine/threonine protein kinase